MIDSANLAIGDASGGIRTEARSLLLAALRTTTRRALANQIGCTLEFVGLCASGKRRPMRWRLVKSFEKVVGIPPESWRHIARAR